MSHQKLKQKDLVDTVFSCYGKTARLQNRPTIEGLGIDMDTLREEISRRTGTERQNNKWIRTQLKKYEEKTDTELFQRKKSSSGKDQLFIVDKLITFNQKKHLHRAEKLRLANGLADYIFSECSSGKEIQTFFLGAGTTVALFAELFCLRRREGFDFPVRIYTNNMGVIDTFKNNLDDSLELHIIDGIFDKARYCIIPREETISLLPFFDLTVQGASFFHDGKVYVETGEEAPVKNGILRSGPGMKILMLTLNEYRENLIESCHPFGKLNDFDLLIIPRMKNPSSSQQGGLEWLNQASMDRAIKQWQYEILHCRRPEPVF